MVTSERIHRATSADGTEVAGHVYGQGPALVFVHGGVGDEDSWRLLVPFLQERFTCYPLSLRGRGLSGKSPDLSAERQVEDVVAFADSIGGPVGLVGHSSGGALALAAATRSDRVTGVATYEPTFPELVDEETGAGIQEAFGRIAAAASAGNLTDAARIMFEEVALANEEELAALEVVDAAAIAGPNVPAFLGGSDFLTHRFLEDGFLEGLTIPIALLYGSRTSALSKGIVDRLAGGLPDAHVVGLAGAGHMAPVAAPEQVAAELTRFFEDDRQPV